MNIGLPTSSEILEPDLWSGPPLRFPCTPSSRELPEPRTILSCGLSLPSGLLNLSMEPRGPHTTEASHTYYVYILVILGPSPYPSLAALVI